MLGAKFNVKSGTAADRMNTDLLYLLLVQKVPLRSNMGNFTVRIPYKSIESPIDENFSPGKEFAMRFDKERKGTLFGYPRLFYYSISYPLGNAVKSTRYQRGLTQLQVADMADIDVRTVMNIENYKANPKMEVLYPLIRALRIDARTIFNPELQRETPALQQLRLMIEECSEQEAEALIPVVESVIAALRTKDAIEIG